MARPDLLSRWVISSLIALLLPGVLLYGEVFYSGHLLAISIFIVMFAWRVVSFIGFPLITLEPASGTPSVERSQSMLIFAVLLVAAMFLDGLIASRFSHDEALQRDRAATTVRSTSR